MKLLPNPRWEKAYAEELPEVVVNVRKDCQFLHVRFQVREPQECFSAAMEKDGGKAWEESCVEIFVRALDNPGEYVNFEFTSKGFCFAARGRDRSHRRKFLPMQYARILRFPKVPEILGESVHWELEISIPANLFGAQVLGSQKIFGNIYKCGDKTGRPHHLSAFPICTDTPDFHEQRFFREIK